MYQSGHNLANQISASDVIFFDWEFEYINATQVI